MTTLCSYCNYFKKINGTSILGGVIRSKRFLDAVASLYTDRLASSKQLLVRGRDLGNVALRLLILLV